MCILVYGGNYLYLLESAATASPGKGCFYILRDSLRANSIDEVIALVNVTNSASGFSLNVMSISEGRIINVEVGPGDHNLAVYELKGDTHWNDHFNNYKNLDTEQYVDKSSLFRSKRVQELSPPVSEHDILEILGDTHNPYYPIYRDGKQFALIRETALLTSLQAGHPTLGATRSQLLSSTAPLVKGESTQRIQRTRVHFWCFRFWSSSSKLRTCGE